MTTFVLPLQACRAPLGGCTPPFENRGLRWCYIPTFYKVIGYLKYVVSVYILSCNSTQMKCLVPFQATSQMIWYHSERNWQGEMTNHIISLLNILPVKRLVIFGFDCFLFKKKRKLAIKYGKSCKFKKILDKKYVTVRQLISPINFSYFSLLSSYFP